MCCAHPQSFLLLGGDWVYRVRFTPVFSFSSTPVSFVILTKGTIIPTLKCIYKYSVCWCNWHKTQTAPRVPNFFSFHTWTFQMTTSRITRNSSRFLALEVPMIPAGMQKRLSLFFCPENNVLPRHSPNASNGANERFVLTNPWKDFPLLSKGPKIYLYSECLCLTKFNSFP